MREKLYTKGPWKLETVETQIGSCHKVGEFPSNGVHETSYACVYADRVRLDDYGTSKIGDELLANARLMSAAPDLLEALEDLTFQVCAAQREHDMGICTKQAEDTTSKAYGETI